MMDAAVLQGLIKAGTESTVFIAVLIVAYLLLNRTAKELVAALNKQAEAMGSQAQAMTGLTTSVQEALKRDSGDHREMLVLLRYIAQKTRDYDEVVIEHEARKKQTHPHCPAGAPKD